MVVLTEFHFTAECNTLPNNINKSVVLRLEKWEIHQRNQRRRYQKKQGIEKVEVTDQDRREEPTLAWLFLAEELFRETMGCNRNAELHGKH